MTYEFRAVGRRLAFDISDPPVPVTREEAITLLEMAGFKVEAVDLDAIAKQARAAVDQASYVRGAKLTEAPASFDCSSFTRWLYARIGLWLPRRTIQQAGYGLQVARSTDMRTGDLLLTRGRFNYTSPERPKIEIGHIGFLAGTDVIHATSKSNNVECTSLEDFMKRFKWRDIRRPIPHPETTLSLSWDDDREVEVSGDVYYKYFRKAVT